MLFLLASCQLPLLAFIFSEAKLKDFLSSAELQRRDRRIRRCALLDANQSPWQKLYHSRNEQSLITFTGFNYASFDYLLSKFQPFYRRYSPYTGNGKISVVRHRVVYLIWGHPLSDEVGVDKARLISVRSSVRLVDSSTRLAGESLWNCYSNFLKFFIKLQHFKRLNQHFKGPT